MFFSPSLFVVFEGLDGSGTSTQARLLHEALCKESLNTSLTSEPTNGPVGNIIRNFMSHRTIMHDKRLEDLSDEERRRLEQLEDHQLAYLFAADRHDHLRNEIDGIQKQLSKGAIVISTRYYLSSFAYHCKTDEDFELVERLNSGFPAADLTFFVECPVEICLRRIEQRQYKREKYEHRDKLLLVRENYSRILSTYKHDLHIVDGEAQPHVMHAKILGVVKEKLCQKPLPISTR